MSDYESKQRRRNMAVGSFVLIAACAVIWLIYKFGDLPIFVSQWKSFPVNIQFPLAPGVQENTPVRFCGYQVGRVVKVTPPQIMENRNTGQYTYQTLITAGIDKQYENVIPEDVEVKLMTRGFGSSYIEFKVKPFGLEQPQGPFLTGKSTPLQGSTGMTSEFFPEESQEKLDQLADDIKTLVVNANDILGDKENKQNIKATLANLTKVTKEAQKAVIELSQFLAAGTKTLENTDTRMEKATVAMVDTAEQLSKTLAETRLILEKINTGQGTAGKLLNDGRLYENLLDNTEQIQITLEQFQTLIEKAGALPIKLK